MSAMSLTKVSVISSLIPQNLVVVFNVNIYSNSNIHVRSSQFGIIKTLLPALLPFTYRRWYSPSSQFCHLPSLLRTCHYSLASWFLEKEAVSCDGD